jgi:hypothetical protein
MQYKAVIEPVSGLVVQVPGTYQRGNATFVIHPGAEAWAPDSRFMDSLGTWAPPNTVIHLHPRSDIRKYFAKDNPHERFPSKPYPFRAWNAPHKQIRMFVDETETPDSVKWGILHEVGHSFVTHTPGLNRLRKIPKPLNYATSDKAHAAVPEEQFCNAFADHLAPMMGVQGRGYDRAWWRKRVDAAGYGQSSESNVPFMLPWVVGALFVAYLYGESHAD